MLTVLDHIRLDHARLRTLLDRARDTSGQQRSSVLRALADALVRHETAEAALVRPRTRETRDGHAVATQLDKHERTIGQLVATLESTPDEDERGVERILAQLRHEVLQHMDAEEDLEHPRLRAEFGTPALQDMGRRYLRVTDLDLDGHVDGVPAGTTPRSFARAREVVRVALTS